MNRRVVVLDDDPTGTQGAAEVTVALRTDTGSLRRFDDSSLYVLTNTRALEPDAARSVLRNVRAAFADDDTGFVLRGDSTLRGHVRLEMNEFDLDHGVGLIVPAFPAAGRITRDGVHLVRIDGVWTNAADTEFARDPVFGYRGRTMTDWATEAGLTDSVVLDHTNLSIETVARTLRQAAAGSVVLCDAVTDDDIATIADGYREAIAGRRVVVRCAAPLAAQIADRPGRMLTGTDRADRVLVVCGSPPTAASRQLATLGRPAAVLPTADLLDPATVPAAVGRTVAAARSAIAQDGIAVVCTERTRRDEHGSLAHAATVMTGLMRVVAELAGEIDAVVSKGGITSAETATTGLGADRAVVRGQIVTGVSLWDVAGPGERTTPLAVVPGNVGDDDTLLEVTRFLTDRITPPAG